MRSFLVSAVTLAMVTSVVWGQSAAITEIEVNQAIGKQFKGNLYFAAGKDTVVRVFLASAITLDSAQSSLTITRDGTQVAKLDVRPDPNPTQIAEFHCPSRDVCGSWAAGLYTFSATVNGITKTTDGTSYVFRPRQPLRILVMPVKTHYNGEILTVKDNRWKTAYRYVSRVYPVAPDQITWDVREEFDASAAKFNLSTEPGQKELWQALTNLIPPGCAATPQAAGCYNLVVGFIERSPNDKSGLQGYTFGMPTNIVFAADQDMEGTVAHEIAHGFKAGDTYPTGSINCSVNPAADGVNGKDFNNPDNPTVCNAGKKAYPGVDSTAVFAAESRPYEVGGRGALPDMAEYMGSNGLQATYWVSPEVYNAVFEGLEPAKTTPQAPTAAAPERLLEYSGFISKQGSVEADRWSSFQSTQPPADTTGDVMIQAVDGSGAVLASQRLDLHYFVQSNPPRFVDDAPFVGTVRFPGATSRFRIVKGASTIYQVRVSANDPQVSGVTPVTAGASVNGTYEIHWNATDADGDALFYTVEYNPNPGDANSPWIQLVEDLDTPSWKEDFDDLPGSRAGIIRVTASDGIRSATAESKPFAVGFKAPEVELFLEEAETYQRGASVLLEGEAEDVQDDIVKDANLVWTSSLDGRLGTGHLLELTKLSVGRHVITLTATNSAGLSASDQKVLTIVPATAAPQIASITNAASGATGPLAPGELITIKGTGLGPVAAVSFGIDSRTHGVDPTLAGSRVLIDGYPAPITYASAGQVNAIVPFEVAGRTQSKLQMEFGGVGSVAQTVSISPAAPGVFTLNSTGTGTAVAANQDGKFNGPATPAAAGSVVVIYFTGGGQTQVLSLTGSVTGAVVNRLAQATTVRVGGKLATVLFAGAAPMLVAGVNQLNIQLAADTPSGEQPVVLTVGGQSSPTTVTLSIR